MSLVESELSNDPNPDKIIPPAKDDKIQSHGRCKAAEDSLSQLEVEEVDEEKAVDEEEEGEGDEEGEGGGEEDDDEVDETCRVCLKDKEHWTFDCPYLVRIPNPLEVTLGPGYYMVCAHCNVFNGHPDEIGKTCSWYGGNPNRRWVRRAAIKVCSICKEVLHRSADYPRKDLLLTRKSVMECVADYRVRLAMEKSQAV